MPILEWRIGVHRKFGPDSEVLLQNLYKFPNCGTTTSIDSEWWLLFPESLCLECGSAAYMPAPAPPASVPALILPASHALRCCIDIPNSGWRGWHPAAHAAHAVQKKNETKREGVGVVNFGVKVFKPVVGCCCVLRLPDGCWYLTWPLLCYSVRDLQL